MSMRDAAQCRLDSIEAYRAAVEERYGAQEEQLSKLRLRKSKTGEFAPKPRLLPLPARLVLSGVAGILLFLVIRRAAAGAAAPAALSASDVRRASMAANHLLVVGVVYGWSGSYWGLVLISAPMAMLPLALGGFAAGHLEEAGFDGRVQSWLGVGGADSSVGADEGTGGLYASMLVMFTMGFLHCMVLSILEAASYESYESLPEEEGEEKEKQS